MRNSTMILYCSIETCFIGTIQLIVLSKWFVSHTLLICIFLYQLKLYAHFWLIEIRLRNLIFIFSLLHKKVIFKKNRWHTHYRLCGHTYTHTHTKPAHFKLKALFLLSIICATLIKACAIGQPFKWREFEHCAAQFDSFLDLDQFWEALTASFHVFCIPVSSCLSLLRSSIVIFFFRKYLTSKFLLICFRDCRVTIVNSSPIHNRRPERWKHLRTKNSTDLLRSVLPLKFQQMDFFFSKDDIGVFYYLFYIFGCRDRLCSKSHTKINQFFFVDATRFKHMKYDRNDAQHHAEDETKNIPYTNKKCGLNCRTFWFKAIGLCVLIRR